MKNKILILLVVLSGTLLNSCYKDTPMFHDPVDGDAQYVQFITGNQEFTMNKLNANNEAEDLTVPISVKMLGSAASSDITVDFDIILQEEVVNGDTIQPLTADMFSLSGNSFTINAGSFSGALDVTFKNLELPLEETRCFTIKLKDGTLPTYSVNNEIVYTIFKKDFCPYDPGDLVGNWDVVENGYYDDYTETYNISAGEGDTLIFTNSFWYNAPTQIWGETVIDVGDPVKVVFDDSDPINPVVYMAKAQYLQTTLDPNGVDEYTYWIADWNTYDDNSDSPWIFEYCAQTLYMNFYIPYGAADGGLVDIVEVTLDWSGGKKIAYVNHHYDVDYNRIIKK